MAGISGFNPYLNSVPFGLRAPIQSGLAAAPSTPAFPYAPPPNAPQNSKGIVGARTLGSTSTVTGGTGTVNPATPTYDQPQPGVAGVTPGAVERRLMNTPPSAQLGMGAQGQTPTNQGRRMALGNTLGAPPGQLTDPVALIRAMLAQRVAPGQM